MHRHKRKSLMHFLAIVAICGVALASAAQAQGNSSCLLAEGSVRQTRYYVIDSNRPGPLVMIVGGIHGNEPAGARAAEQIRAWQIDKGRLIVLPRANVPALTKRTRLTPDTPKELGNLNRNFPQTAGESPKCDLSKAIWSVVRAERPDWLLDLHEGYDFTQINGKSVGSSLIAAKTPEVTAQARRMLDAVNETIEDPNRKLVLKGPPVAGSMARSASEILEVKAMILETTYKDQPISLRTRQHRIMVHRLLRDLAMVSHGHDILVARSKPPETIRAALYDGGGVGRSLAILEEDLAKMERIVLRRVGEQEVAAGVLTQFDLLIVPGGSGSKQARALGNDGCRAIVKFVDNGGGYAGFCAGAYLASNNYTWSLKIIDARVIDRKHWKRGTGRVKIELTSKGRRFFKNKSALVDIHYANGPLLAPDEDPNIPDFETLARFRTEINKNGAPEGVMKNTPAMIAGRFGRGRVFCSSPHPEYTDGLENLIEKAIRWAARR